MMQVYANLLHRELSRRSDPEILAFFRDFILPSLSQNQRQQLRNFINEAVPEPKIITPASGNWFQL